MDLQALNDVARAMVEPGKGILAADAGQRHPRDHRLDEEEQERAREDRRDEQPAQPGPIRTLSRNLVRHPRSLFAATLVRGCCWRINR